MLSDLKECLKFGTKYMTNLSSTLSVNVQDLPTPQGDISAAQLDINSCKSNNRNQYPLTGAGQTLMEAFRSQFNFNVVRGTSYGVSYDRITKNPFPGHTFIRGTWDYMYR